MASNPLGLMLAKIFTKLAA